jgi:S1/P1 Nuclease
MKKHLLAVLGLILSLALVSWGYEGHYAVGAIAENHLNANAKAAVKALLGHETMADVASYADDLRSNPAFAASKDLHYLNIPLGYSYPEFTNYIKNSLYGNVYTGIASCINTLKDPKSGKREKELALELLVHFVGDCHQPMHVSRVEDKGGNNIIVNFLGSNTNLHGLWDYGLIQHEKIPYKDLAAKYDDATPGQIAKWQNDNVMTWLWESYQITTILYQEAADNPNFDEKYYQDHIPIVKNRIEKAGIRLAGVLNDIYR